MKLHKWPRRILKKGYVYADDRAFRDFIESISVTKEELKAIIRMPEFSIQEIKQYLQDGKNCRPQRESTIH